MDSSSRLYSVNIIFDNVNLSSSSGPNSFAKKIAHAFKLAGHQVHYNPRNVPDPRVQLSFILQTKRCAPSALRLDGIYFNTEQDWAQMNAPIKDSFENSKAIIY